MERKLRLAIYTEGFYAGGTERQLVELIKGIDRDRFSLSVLSSRPGGPMEQDLHNADIPITYFPLKSLKEFNALRQLWRLRSFLCRHEIDVLHTYSITGNTFAVLAGLLARTPIIITSRRDMGVMIPPIYRPLQVAFSYCADAVTTNALAIKNMLVERERVNPDKISVIYNGIDLTRFTASGARGEARRALGISARAPVIGMVAQIKPIKGHIYLIKAAHRLTEWLPDLRLLIIGDGNERADLEKLVSALGISENVIFVGYTSEVTRLLSALDVSVLSSLSEGISNSVLESMAVGVPVVATAVGGNIELITPERTGLLVPPADAEALAAAILRLLTDRALHERLAHNAHRMVMERFANERMVENFQRLYSELAEARLKHRTLLVRAGLRRVVST